MRNRVIAKNGSIFEGLQRTSGNLILIFIITIIIIGIVVFISSYGSAETRPRYRIFVGYQFDNALQWLGVD